MKSLNSDDYNDISKELGIEKNEDTEELALTLCWKKRKHTPQHFREAMLAAGLDEKICENIFTRFVPIQPEWGTCIRKSSLSQEEQERYISLIGERLGAYNRV